MTHYILPDLTEIDSTPMLEQVVMVDLYLYQHCNYY